MEATDCIAKTSVRWGGKDGKWRWLAEVVKDDMMDPALLGSRAGEERRLADALMAAANAAEEILDGIR